ncbi:MAG: glycosyltransferase [Geobacter sp.]|nr:glycosyltransferase [Geobacter sp.]
MVSRSRIISGLDFYFLNGYFQISIDLEIYLCDESPIIMKTSICILTYNRCESISALLKSIYHLLDDNTEIIVVDNHSSDDTPNSIPSKFPNISYLRTDKNVGASGRNVAFSHASGEIVICLDDDVFGLTSEMISSLGDKFRNNPNIGAINFKVLNAFTGDICNWVHHCLPEKYSEKEILTYELTEGAVAFKKEVLDKSGYYDDMYFISHEGPDLAFRIMCAGYDCIYWPDVVVKHRHENTGRVSWLNYYYDTRNHIYITVKNFPFWYGVVYLFVGLSSMFVYSIRDGFFGYWLKAVFDGLVKLPNIWSKRSVLPDHVMGKIRTIDQNKAPLIYKIKSRLFKKGARL